MKELNPLRKLTPLRKQEVEVEQTKTISMLRGERDNAGTRIMHLYGLTVMLANASRYDAARKTEARLNEILNWLDRHDIKADEGDYTS
jgi:hypothetical protein